MEDMMTKRILACFLICLLSYESHASDNVNQCVQWSQGPVGDIKIRNTCNTPIRVNFWASVLDQRWKYIELYPRQQQLLNSFTSNFVACQLEMDGRAVVFNPKERRCIFRDPSPAANSPATTIPPPTNTFDRREYDRCVMKCQHDAERTQENCKDAYRSGEKQIQESIDDEKQRQAQYSNPQRVEFEKSLERAKSSRKLAEERNYCTERINAELNRCANECKVQ